jgi:hypothetical protein
MCKVQVQSREQKTQESQLVSRLREPGAYVNTCTNSNQPQRSSPVTIPTNLPLPEKSQPVQVLEEHQNLDSSTNSTDNKSARSTITVKINNEDAGTSNENTPETLSAGQTEESAVTFPKVSVVPHWDFFKITEDDKEQSASCTVCGNEIPAKSAIALACVHHYFGQCL